MVTAVAPPAAIVIFGASGDLAARKLLPALSALESDGLLHEATCIIGVGRGDPPDDWTGHWVTGDYADPATYDTLADELAGFDRQGCAGNRLFYLAVPPDLFAPIVDQLGEHGLQRAG